MITSDLGFVPNPSKPNQRFVMMIPGHPSEWPFWLLTRSRPPSCYRVLLRDWGTRL